MTPTPVTSLYTLDRDLSRTDLIDALAAIPDRLRHALDGAAPAALLRSQPPGEWAPMQVCRHLRDAVQVYGLRFKYIILQNDPFLPNYDEDAWAAQSPDGPADIAGLLTQIEGDRAETVRLLRALPETAWSRTGRHEVLGTVALEAYLRHELVHEEQHLQQLSSALRQPDLRA